MLTWPSTFLTGDHIKCTGVKHSSWIHIPCVTTICTQDFTFCKEDCQLDTHWYQRNYLLSLLYPMWLMTSNRQLWYKSLIMINTINVYIHHIASRETDLMISVQYTREIWVKRITRFTSFLPRKLKPIAVAVTITFIHFHLIPIVYKDSDHTVPGQDAFPSAF